MIDSGKGFKQLMKEEIQMANKHFISINFKNQMSLYSQSRKNIVTLTIPSVAEEKIQLLWKTVWHYLENQKYPILRLNNSCSKYNIP